MRNWKSFLVLGATALAAACGGGGSPFGSGGGSSSSTTQITVQTSAAQIAADGSTSATITAVARDANNNFVANVNVSFTASAGGLAVTQGTTDTSGIAIATLSAAGAAAGTNIVVTASSGGVTGQVMVAVVNIQQSVSVTTSLVQIPSDSSKGAQITALVRGANNQFLQGVAVSFGSTSGGLTVTQGTTDANGAATANLNAAGDPTNRRITVTVSAGSATPAAVDVDVTGTTLTFSGQPALVQGSQATYTATLTDSGSKPIVGKNVTFSSSNGNTLSATSGTTNSNGQATVTVTAVNGGNDTLTASALGLQSQQVVAVSNQSFAFIAPAAANAKVNLGALQAVTVVWTAGGAAQSGQTVTFAATRGTLSSATAVTNGSGQASVSISSNISGPSVITASGTGVSAQASVSFVATTPAAIAVQASPSTVPTQGNSTITATVRDAQNNLVEGATVQFSNPNDTTGGALSVATALTNSQGQATSVYAASSTPSASNGVTIQATVQGTAISASTTLTVGGQTVFLSLATGNQMTEDDPTLPTKFIVPYSVQALDAAGNAVAGVKITLTIHATQYAKGGYLVSGSQWVQTGTPHVPSFTPITVCPNEDSNLNGILEPGLGEDVAGLGNNNGVLDPGDRAVTDASLVTTGSDGSAPFKVIYGEQYGLWVQVKLTATATVAGTETSTSSTFWLPMLAIYLTTTTAIPPSNGGDSPFGYATTCTNPN